MVYFIALLGALIGVFLNNRMTTNFKKVSLIVLCVYMIMVMGFRYRVGVDTYAYMASFSKIPTIDHLTSLSDLSRTRFELGFVLLCSICKSIVNEFWLLQIVMSTITTSCIFIFLYRNCKNVFIGVAIYFVLQWFYFSTEIIRESAAIGIFLLNYKNLQEKKWMKYYLISILSILFHYSAIIIWFFPFTKWLKVNYYFIILCVCFLLITPLVENLNRLLAITAISGRITQYVESAQTLNLNWRLSELFRSFPPVFICLWIILSKKLHTKFLHMLLLQVLFCVGAFAIPIIFSRFTNYTTLFVTVAAANILSLPLITRWLKVVVISTLLISQSYYYHTMYKTWFPYVSIFYPENLPVRKEMYRFYFFGWRRHP